MPLVSLKSILTDASKENYAVGAFNINNLEILQSVVLAAEDRSSPAIIQVSEGAIEYAGLGCLVAMVKALVSDHRLPFVLHLDHGKNPEMIARCMEAGFTSVMIDGSDLPFDENVAVTRKTVDLAGPRGISVEGELGILAGVEDQVSVKQQDARFTDPDEARIFVEKTGVDALAVAVGTSHGAYKFRGRAELALDRIQAIRRCVGIPLVLHGASGVDSCTVSKAEKFGAELSGARGIPPETIKKAVAGGICKVNIDTDLRLAFIASLRETLAKNPTLIDPRKVLGPGRRAMAELVGSKMDLFGSSGRVQLST